MADERDPDPHPEPESELPASSAEKRTRQRLDRMMLLQQITRATNERQDPGSIFQVVVSTLEGRMPVDFGAIWTFEPGVVSLDDGYFGFKGRALAPDLCGEKSVRPSLDPAGLETCLGGPLIYEEDISQAAAPLLVRLAELGLRSVVLAPLRTNGKAVGLLVACRRRLAAFSSSECEFLQLLSENVALSAHQAELHGVVQKAYEELKQTQSVAVERDRLRALGEMASGLAHNINNLISPAALHLEALLERSGDWTGNTRPRLEVVHRAVREVAQLVDRMQVLYRGQDANENTRFLLDPLVEQVLELTRAKWRDMPHRSGMVIAVEKRLAAGAAAIRGYSDQIGEALIQLIFNAVDAMPRGGSLVVATSVSSAAEGKPGPRIKLEVIDSGIGMDAATRLRCFEPFFSTKKERGRGLGLPMVFGVGERHGGEVEIHSEVGKGTTVRLSFPAAEEAGAPQAAAVPEPVPPAEETAAMRPLKILVVDDDTTLLETLVEVFSGDGHQVSAAAGGAEGIAAFMDAHKSQNPFELVLTDLGMPHVDGRQVAAAVKGIAPATPVILLTGWGQRLISKSEQPPNFDAVLSKPPRLKELRQAVSRLR